MKVAAIIPAYNEQDNIERVLKIFTTFKGLHEVIVVDDGSTDKTAEIAKKYPIRLISQKNMGKGAAMLTGVKATDAEIIFFCDADLLNFSQKNLQDVLAPVQQNQAAMTIGLRDRGDFLVWLLPKIAPVLGGERALKREIFLALEGIATKDFGIETMMNAYCQKNKLAVKYVKMPGVSQVIKEKKWGVLKGFFWRLKMIYQILRAEYLAYKNIK